MPPIAQCPAIVSHPAWLTSLKTWIAQRSYREKVPALARRLNRPYTPTPIRFARCGPMTMLAPLVTARPIPPGQMENEMALQVRVEDGATIRTRNGHDYTGTFPEIAKAARGFDNGIIDGEICAVGKDGLTDFSALQAAMKGDRTDKLILFAFDLLFIGREDLRSYHLMERKAELRTLLEANSDQTVIRFQDHLDAAGNDVIDIACDMKLEGIVSKRLSEPYVSGATRHRWRLDGQ
jgi:hypothetical protein